MRDCGATHVQEKSLASQSWEGSRLGTLDSADEPLTSGLPATDPQSSNGNGSHQFDNGNGRQQGDHSSSAASERHKEERRKREAPLSTISLDKDSVDEMWQAGGDVAAHDAPAAAPKKAI